MYAKSFAFDIPVITEAALDRCEGIAAAGDAEVVLGETADRHEDHFPFIGLGVGLVFEISL